MTFLMHCPHLSSFLSIPKFFSPLSLGPCSPIPNSRTPPGVSLKRSSRPSLLPILHFFSCLIFVLTGVSGYIYSNQALALAIGGERGKESFTSQGLRTRHHQWKVVEKNSWRNFRQKILIDEAVCCSSSSFSLCRKEDLAADVFSPSSSARVVASASSFPFQEGSFSSSPRPSLSSSASFSTSPASSRRLYSPKHFLRADTYSPSMFKRRGLRRSHSPPSMGPVSSSELHPRKLSSPSHTRLLDTAFLSSTSDPSAPSSLQEETAHKPSSSRPSSIRGFFGSLGYDGVPVSYPTARSPVFYSSLSSPKCFFSSRLFSSASRPLFSSSLSLSSPLSGRTSNFPQKGRRSSLSSVFRNPPSKREAFVFSIRHGLHMIKYSKGKNAVTSPGYMKPWSSHFFLSPPHASSSLSFPQIFRSPFSVSVKGFQLPTKISGTTNLSLLRSKVVPAAHRSQKDRRHLCLSGTQGNRWKEPLEKKKESSPFMSSSFKLTRGEERDYPRHHHGHSRLSSSSSSESSSDTSSLSSLSLAQAEVMARDIVEVQAARSAVAASESEVSRPSSLYHSTEHVKKRVLGPCSTAVPVPVRREMEQEERETFLMGEDDERQEEEVRKGQGKENNEWPGEPMKPEGETTRKCEDVFEEEEEDIQQSLTMSSTSPSKTDEKSSEEHEEKKKKTKGVKKGKGKKEEKWEALAESDWHLYPRESFFNEDGTMNYERAPDTMPFMTTSAKLRLLASRQREVYKTRRATDRRPGARSWRDYLSWLPPDNPDDWKGFPPPPNKRLEDLPVKTIIVDNETILYRQACDEAPMFIDDETFERLKSKWNDTEELARVQREEKHLYDIAESFPDDCWVPIKPNLPMGRLVTDYGLIPNITLTAPGYDYIETYHDPSRNYTWSYKRWNPLKQEGEPPRDMENETKSIFELDSDISRRYWREEPRPPEKLPDDGVFRQVTLAEEMTRGMKRTPIGSDQWHYTPTNPLGQMAQPQNFWLTALNRTLDQARVQAREENLRAKTATEIYLRAVMEGRRSELEAVPDAIPLWSIPSGSSAPEDGDGNAHKNREEKSTRTENEDSDGGDRMQQGASQHNMPGPSLVQEKSKKRRNARLDVKAGPTKETSSSCCAEFSLSSPLPAKGSPASKFEAARVPSVRRSAYQPLTEVDIEAGEACDEMKYRQLGRSDLFVSEVGLGTMTVGSPQLGRDRAMSLFDYAIDHWGVNFIDTAELYPLPALPVTYGRSEEIIGDWLMKRGRRKREELVIATKVAGRSAQLSWLRGGAGADDGPRVHHTDRSLHTIEASQYGDLRQQWRGTCLSRKQIIQAAEGSLHRLKTDYIDLFQLHWPDRYVPSHASGDSADVLFDPQRAMDHDNAVDAVPMEEQLEAIGELLRDGKIRAWGLSNETPYGVCRFTQLASRMGIPPPASVQLQYNLLCRNDVEKGFVELARPQNAGTSLLAYGALAGGILTGKYLEWLEYPTTGRMLRFPSYMKRYRGSLAARAVMAYFYLALRLEHPNLTVMALRWVLSRPFICSTVLGFTDFYQLRENLFCTTPACGVISDWAEREINFLHWKWRDVLRIIQ